VRLANDCDFGLGSNVFGSKERALKVGLFTPGGCQTGCMDGPYWLSSAVVSTAWLGVSSVQSEGQTGAIAPSLDTSNTIVLLTK
jgi:hypothetical protein